MDSGSHHGHFLLQLIQLLLFLLLLATSILRGGGGGRVLAAGLQEEWGTVIRRGWAADCRHTKWSGSSGTGSREVGFEAGRRRLQGPPGSLCVDDWQIPGAPRLDLLDWLFSSSALGLPL